MGFGSIYFHSSQQFKNLLTFVYAPLPPPPPLHAALSDLMRLQYLKRYSVRRDRKGTTTTVLHIQVPTSHTPPPPPR